MASDQMLTVYLDESGMHRGSPGVVIAGWLAPDDQWERFNESWTTLLRRYNLPSFHMNRFENRIGPFASVTPEERCNLMRSLVTHIRIRTYKGIACVINIKDNEEVVPRSLRPKVGSPYFLCANLCLESVREWADARSHQGPINFMFEDGAEHRGQVRDAFERMRRKQPDFIRRYRIGRVDFVEKRLCAPVQAADLLAYEVWKDYCNDLKEKPRDQRWPLAEMPNVPIALKTLDKSELQRLVDKASIRSTTGPEPKSSEHLSVSKGNGESPARNRPTGL